MLIGVAPDGTLYGLEGRAQSVTVSTAPLPAAPEVSTVSTAPEELPSYTLHKVKVSLLATMKTPLQTYLLTVFHLDALSFTFTLLSFLNFWLHWVLVAALGIFAAVCGSNYSMAYGIVVPQPGIEPMSLALEGRFLITGLSRGPSVHF